MDKPALFKVLVIDVNVRGEFKNKKLEANTGTDASKSVMTHY